MSSAFEHDTDRHIMSARQPPLNQVQPTTSNSYWSNSLAIRQEIQRFESVHPSIYAIYDLIESVPDPVLGQQIRDHVVCIEGMSRPSGLHLKSPLRDSFHYDASCIIEFGNFFLVWLRSLHDS